MQDETRGRGLRKSNKHQTPQEQYNLHQGERNICKWQTSEGHYTRGSFLRTVPMKISEVCWELTQLQSVIRPENKELRFPGISEESWHPVANRKSDRWRLRQKGSGLWKVLTWGYESGGAWWWNTRQSHMRVRGNKSILIRETNRSSGETCNTKSEAKQLANRLVKSATHPFRWS